MSMTQSLLTGVTGLKGSQFSLDVTGSNLANIGTVGFKASRVGFADLLSQSLFSAQGSDATANRGGVNPGAVGTGLGVASADAAFTQGTLLVSGSPTDLALQGDGFFILNSGNDRVYSRAGSFRFDSLGRLVSPDGKLVQGWMAQADPNNRLAPPVLDTSNPAQIGNIQVNRGMTLQPHETTILDFVGNLDAGATPAALGFPQNTWVSKLPVTQEIRSNIVDSLGNEHPLVLQLKNISGLIDDEVISPLPGAVNDPVLGAQAMPNPFPPGAYPNNVWRFEFSIDPSDTTATLAPDGSYVGESSPDKSVVPDAPGDFQMFARSGFLVFDTNGSLQEVRYGKYFDYPVGTWPEQTATFQEFPFAVVSYDLKPAPLMLLFQNPVEPDAPNPAASVPEGVSAGLTIQDRYPTEEAAGGNNHLLQTVYLVGGPPPVPFPVYIGPASVTDGVTTQYVVVDDPASTTNVFSTTPPVGYDPAAVPPGTARADFYCQPITVNFGSGGTPANAAVPQRFVPTVAMGASVDWRYQTVSGGSRDGFTQDTTGRTLADGTYVSACNGYLRHDDGYREGTLSSLSVDAFGRIQGAFDNGVTVALGQVAIANFENPRGLTRVGAAEFDETANSGSARIGTAGYGGRGEVASGVLEQSNVDASRELSDMIVAQRSFEANSRIISTADRVLETLANLGT